MNDLYYNKYLKYKNKYLDLKHGGQGKYVPPHARNTFYIEINQKIFHPISFECKFIDKLLENGYEQTKNKSIAKIVYLSDTYSFPQRKKDELEWDYDRKKNIYLHQFSRIQWINLLWGYFKEIVADKIKFHEYFKETLKEYFINWNQIKRKNREDDISKIKFNEGESKILKASNSYKSIGTIVVKNIQEIKDHIIYYDTNPLIGTGINKYEKEPLINRLAPLYAKDWIVEDLIKQDTINSRPFFIRVHILVICKYKDGKKIIKVYISNKHPYIIQRTDKECKYLSHECIDTIVGSHLLHTGGGHDSIINEDGNRVIYNFKENPYWPQNKPDNYDNTYIENINLEMLIIFKKIFSDKLIKDINPDFNSPNGFEIFGCDVSLVGKKIKLHEINRYTGLILQAPFIEDIIKVLKNEESFSNFDLLPEIEEKRKPLNIAKRDLKKFPLDNKQSNAPFLDKPYKISSLL